jgi:hypothetical protein
MRDCLAGSPAPALFASYADSASAEVVALKGDYALQQLGTYPSIIEYGRVPRLWIRFLQESKTTVDSRVAFPTPAAPTTVVFCHERISPGGHARLVAVLFLGNGGFGDRLDKEPVAQVYAATAWNGIKRLRNCGVLPAAPDPSRAKYLPMPQRIYAGQVDPADSSRFTVEFEQPGGDHGLVMGRLNDDDSVEVTFRAGSGATK